MKISFISAVSDYNFYNNFCLPTLPDSQEYIAVEKAKSICEAYNIGIDAARYKVKCFIHEDVRIFDEDFVKKVEDIFEDKEIGLIGVIGSVIDAGMYTMMWDTGTYVHHSTGLDLWSMSKRVDKPFMEVNVIDGLMMITNKDIRFDEETYNSWHFYDMDYCKQMQKEGYKVVVANISVGHFPLAKMPSYYAPWKRERQKFLIKWRLV